MRTVIAVVVLVVAGVVGLGFYRGWFSVTSDNGNNKSDITLTVNKNKFKEDKKAVAESTGLAGKKSEGTIVSLDGDTLTIADKEGKELRHPLAENVKFTCDGKVCTAADLKPGMKIRVTTNDKEPHGVIRIEALDKNADFAKST